MSLPSWPELHGALTHFPVALLITACVFEIGAMILHKPAGRFISFWMLVAAVVMAVPALATGWLTGNTMFGKSPSLPTVFVWHRAMAFTTTGIALLLLIWRSKARDQLMGSSLTASVLLILIVAGAAGYTGYLGGRMVFGGHAEASGSENEPHTQKQSGAPGATTAQKPQVSQQDVQAGQKLFQSLTCLSCHTINGNGGTQGPILTHEARRHADMAWQIKHLQHPNQVTPGSFMPSFAQLKPDQLKALAAFLVTRE